MLDINAVCYYLEGILKLPVFHLDRENHETEREHDKEVQGFLQMLSEEDFKVLRQQEVCIHRMEQGIFWGGVNAGERLYLIGPTGFEPFRTGSKYYKTDYVAFVHCLLMLEEAVNGKRIGMLEFMMQNDAYQKWDQMLAKRRVRFLAHKQENEAVHNSYAQERREQQAIRDGSLERFERAVNEPLVGSVGNIRVEENRLFKDLALMVYMLSTRSAMEGGLDCEECFNLNDIFLEQVEHKTSGQEAFQLLRFAQHDLVMRVANLKNSKNQNPLVEEAKQYIKQHIRGDVSVKAVAEYLGVTENYLSRIFSKCEKKGMKQYVLELKIENAGLFLIYTDMACDEIAYYYGFSSSSHFAKTFRRKMGKTPLEYRREHKARRKAEDKIE